MIELSIKRPLIVFVIFAIIALLGTVTFSLLNINLIPSFDVNVITVTTTYPGASASEVETSVTKKVEDALSSLENLDRLTSNSQEGFMLVQAELVTGADPDIALQDAQRKVNAILADLPEDVTPPAYSKFSSDDLPIMSIAVNAQMKPTEFYKLVEDRIQPRLSKIGGVGQVALAGGTERQIKVNVDSDRLKAYNISILQVVQAVQKANQDFPTGKVEDNTKQYTIRLSAKYGSLDELRNTVIINTAENGRIILSDIAEVEDGIAEQTKINRYNNRISIGLQILKQSDANSVEIARAIKKEIASMQQEYAKDELTFDIASDASVYTLASVNAVLEDLVIAVIIVSIVCLTFLHSLRSALIVMVAVPLSMIPSFIFMYFFGYTLNLMSLMALSLAVGILVDDSIVVVENIYRHLEMGKSVFKAALEGSKQIVFTAASITLVIVVVFLPLTLMGGIVGNILTEFAVPLIVSTLTSLLVSFTLTPLLYSKFGHTEDLSSGTVSSRIAAKIEHYYNELKLLYEMVLRWGIKHKAIVYAAVTVLFFAAVSLIPFGFIGSAFVAETDQGEFAIQLEFAPQTTVAENNAITQQVEKMLFSKPEVISVYTTVGATENYSTSTSKNNASQLKVTIVDKSEREIGIDEYGQEIKNEILNSFAGVKVTVAPVGLTGGASGKAIEIAVKGADLVKVQETAAMVLNVVKNTKGTTDEGYSIDDPRPEIQVSINRDKMAQLGLSIADVGGTLRTALAGNDDSKYRDGAYEYDINISLDKFDRTNIDDVGNLTFINNSGENVALKQFADITQVMGASTLERMDRVPSIKVTCNVIGRPSGTVGEEIKEKVAGRIPAGVEVDFVGNIERQSDAFGSLFFALIAAVVLIYLIMVALYNSLLYPFVVLFSIPVAIIGALLMLALTMQDLTIFTIVGILTMIGLVAKNAILLVDFTNHLKATGMAIEDAVIEAGKERLRPILMTTLAMVFGMLPIAIASGAGAEIKNGLAWAIIGGLISSLMLTLVLVPSVYLTFEGIKTKIAAKKKKSFINEAEALSQPVKQ
jgi:HAE1 family hydrophobic/amphiphilic exporter-1